MLLSKGMPMRTTFLNYKWMIKDIKEYNLQIGKIPHKLIYRNYNKC